MTRLPLVIAIACTALVATGVIVYRGLRASDATLPATVDVERAAPARTEPTPSPETPSIPTSDRRPTRRASASKAPAASPTTSPVDTAPTAGTLLIVSDIPNAQVFLDRGFIGATPATAKDVTPGAHQLNVSAPGYDALVQTIDVSPGSREISIKFREVRLNAAIDVVHKHRMGSCRGRLVATPQGLRYQTTDENDMFGAALLELATFQIDYLTKNLRIQPRKGKRYDFTDPEGNADRLFVFHRDVERARERLKKGDVPASQ